MIAVIDYGRINLGSILNMLKKIGEKNVVVTSRPQELTGASKIILPGVGAFDAAMERLNELGLKDALTQKIVTDKIPTLGICLGMQLLTKGSEEGNCSGLGVINAECVRFLSNDTGLKVPHMGWNRTTAVKPSTLLDANQVQRFYFVHSYKVVCHDQADILSTTEYGGNFTSSFEREHVVGAQFHPEKSHSYGIEFFKRFVGQGHHA